MTNESAGFRCWRGHGGGPGGAVSLKIKSLLCISHSALESCLMTFFVTCKGLGEVSRRKYHDSSDPFQEDWARQGGLYALWLQELLTARAEYVLQLCVDKAGNEPSPLEEEAVRSTALLVKTALFRKYHTLRNIYWQQRRQFLNHLNSN